MDAFSEILSGVKLNGALFFSAEFSAPWCFASPASNTLAPLLAPGVDRGGHALAVLRDPLAGPHTVNTAIGKASTAVSFRMDTGDLARETQSGRPQSGIRDVPGVVAVGGGLPIPAKGSLVGGIGVSGAPSGDADAICAKAGVAAVSDNLELE